MTTTSIAAELILRGGSLYEPGTAAPRRSAPISLSPAAE